MYHSKSEMKVRGTDNTVSVLECFVFLLVPASVETCVTYTFTLPPLLPCLFGVFFVCFFCFKPINQSNVFFLNCGIIIHSLVNKSTTVP